jgi:hypothetical protein
MKPKQTVASLTALLWAGVAMAAEPVTTMVWEFSTPDNPATVKPPQESNPAGGTGTVTVNAGVGLGYFPGKFEPLGEPTNDYGTQTGLWDILNGDVKLDVDLMPAAPDTKLNYTLTLTYFVSPQNFPYSQNVTFSIPGVQLVSQTGIENTVQGTWVEGVYAWEQLSVPGALYLVITPEAQRGFLLDSLAFSVTGNLVPVPEPSTSALALFGLAFLGFAGRRRNAR